MRRENRGHTRGVDFRGLPQLAAIPQTWDSDAPSFLPIVISRGKFRTKNINLRQRHFMKPIWSALLTFRVLSASLSAQTNQTQTFHLDLGVHSRTAASMKYLRK